MTVVTNPARRDSEEEEEEDDPWKGIPTEVYEAQYQANLLAEYEAEQQRRILEGRDPDDDDDDDDDTLTRDSERERERDPAARLYDDEKQSDITFVAGINGETYRYPGHRRVLAPTSPVFAALLAVDTDLIVVDYVDRRGFEQLLRYHYCEPTKLDSVTTARCALDAAYKFLCPPLAERCARRLDDMLDARAALEVLRDLRFLCARLPGAASAPPLPAFTSEQAARFLAQCSRWCDSLAHNALLVVDEQADAVLTDERFEELSYEDVALIVRRETLRMSSELVLAEALARWSTAACRRSKRELTPYNRRMALGALAYCPRYLLLGGEELERALALELLQPVERALVVGRALRHSAPVPVGAEQEALLSRWEQPRPAAPAALPVHLSARSEPEPEEPAPTGFCARRRPKGPQTPSFIPEDRSRKEKGCCASFGDCLLRTFVCLFD